MRRKSGKLSWHGEQAAAEAGDTDRLTEGGVSAAEGEVIEEQGRSDGQGVFEKAGDEAAVGVSVVERGTGVVGAIGGFDGVEGATSDGAEVGGGVGGVGGGAGGGAA